MLMKPIVVDPRIEARNAALDKTIEVIERGWCIGSLYTLDHQNHCVLGAFNVAAHGHGDWEYHPMVGYLFPESVRDAMFATMRAAGVDHWTMLASWNNTGTKEIILAGLAKAKELPLA